MEITVHLPDDLAQRPNPGRDALESLVIEGYRTGALSSLQSSQILGLSRFEFEGFLKERQIFDHAYGAEDLAKDWTTVQGEIERRAEQYTNWLRECPETRGFDIDQTPDKGPFPYQWKIYSRDPLAFVGYVTMDGPIVGASEAEKRRYLCEEFRKTVREAREAGRLS